MIELKNLEIIDYIYSSNLLGKAKVIGLAYGAQTLKIVLSLWLIKTMV